MKASLRALFAVLLLSMSVAVFAENKAEEAAKKEEKKVPLDEPSKRIFSEDREADLHHYRTLSRRLGVYLGILVPLTDFQASFDMAPAIGLSYTWEAIRPFGFSVGMFHASSPYKTNAASGMLSVTAVPFTTQATFTIGHFMPYLRMGGALFFNSVSFDAGRIVTAGYDNNLTSVGIVAGAGLDFIVGRELGLGIDVSLYYPVPKYVSTTTERFNLGSPFVLCNIRLNF